MVYLLDSNVWIEVLKSKKPRLVSRFISTPASEMSTCAPVRAELMHGSEKYDEVDLRKAVLEIALAKVISLPFDDRRADPYAIIRHDLEHRRCVIGPMDLQIAAIALVHDLTVVTGNKSEFSRVHGLKVKDWSV
jgi:tRNA(fMet)-specific endonuclease VapC